MLPSGLQSLPIELKRLIISYNTNGKILLDIVINNIITSISKVEYLYP